MGKKRKRRKNKLYWIFVLLIGCLYYSIVSCDTKNNQSKKTEGIDLVNPENDEKGSIENCDSVWRIGVPFILLNDQSIDSVKCIRNKTFEARVDIRKNENIEIVIFDTITYKNNYEIFLYSSKKCRIVSLNKILFKPREVNGGFTVCSLKSCELDSKLIVADAGKFYLSL